MTKNEFISLSESKKNTLLKIPALLTLLAASYSGLLEKDKEDAVKLTHLRTFSAEPELQFYYMELEKVFQKEMDELIQRYYPLDSEKRKSIVAEINEANTILEHVDKEFAFLFKHSMKTYEEHVIRSRNNVVEYFLFPFDLPSLKL
jgi:hypothetical protein